MTHDCFFDVRVVPGTGTHRYRYRVKTYHWLPKWTPWHEDAITIGRTIYCLTDCPPDLHAHEFLHIRQWQEYGYLGFLARYLWDSLRHGYWLNRFEMEAREYARLFAPQFRALQ